MSNVLFLNLSAIQNSWSGPTIFAEGLCLRKNNESNMMFLECTVAVACLYWQLPFAYECHYTSAVFNCWLSGGSGRWGGSVKEA